MIKIRNGRSIRTIIHDAFQCSEFHEIDNLDTKSKDQAANNYEKVFILIRKTLEENNSLCCDDERDRLEICQIVTDCLSQNLVIRKD